MSKKLKIITPIITASMLTSIVPFALTSCADKKQDKEDKTAKTVELDTSATPNGVDYQSEFTPLTITNNSTKAVTFRSWTTTGEEFSELTTSRCKYRIGTGDTWSGVFDNNTFYYYDYDDSKIIIPPQWTIQIFLCHTLPTGNIGYLSTKDNKLHFSLECQDHDTPITIGGSLFSLLGYFEGTIASQSWWRGATEIATDYAFSELFANCPDVKFTVSNNLLPFKTLTPHCYDSMFKGCAGLMNMPSLPAQTLTEGCYQDMFNGCTSLQTGSNIAGYVVANDCFTNMFYNCNNLNLISLGYVGNFDEKFFKDWVKNAGSNVASGIIRYNGLDTDEQSDYGIPTNFKVIQDENLIKNHTTTLTIEGDGTTSEVTGAKPELRVYSDDEELTFGNIKNQLTDYAPVTDGDSLIGWFDENGDEISYGGFSLDDETLISDLIAYFTDYELAQTIIPKYGIPEGEVYDSGCVNLIVEEEATAILTEKGSSADDSRIAYKYYVPGAESKNDPVWSPWYRLEPNTDTGLTLYAGRTYCFKGKTLTSDLESQYTNLKITGGKVKLRGSIKSFCCTNTDDVGSPDTWTIPTSEETLTDYCFASLFKGSDGIISVEEGDNEYFLPAKTLTNFCYARLFQGCTSLTTAPKLPATTAAGACYYAMFQGCTNLATVPSLDLETLADPVECTAYPTQTDTGTLKTCYKGVCDFMFYQCTNLTTVPEKLKPTTVTDRAYNMMFEGCSKLADLPKICATSIPDAQYYTDDGLVNDYHSLGLRGACNSMFKNTAVVDATNVWNDPNTPPTAGKASMYQMFGGCESLIKIPKLNTTLTEYCYKRMFYYSSNLLIYDDEAESGTSVAFFTSPSSIPTSACSQMFGYTGNYSGDQDGLVVAKNTTYYYKY